MSNKIGGIIYALRKVKGITQEELGDILSVSGTAVSKWERGITYPDIEVVLKMADYFEVTTDELFGRKSKDIEIVGTYNLERVEMLEMAEQLLRCHRLSCAEGLLAVECKAEKNELTPFLCFVVKKVFELFRQDMSKEMVERLLYNYCKFENNESASKMAVDTVITMFDGVSESTIIQIIASYFGKDYGEKFLTNMNNKDINIQKIYEGYTDKEVAVPMLEELNDCDDEKLKMIIRNVDNVVLVNALSGASGELYVRFLRNISEKLVHFINKDIKNCDASLKEMIDAQKEIIQLAAQLNIIEVK